jgi:hypothetical protein
VRRFNPFARKSATGVPAANKGFPYGLEASKGLTGRRVSARSARLGAVVSLFGRLSAPRSSGRAETCLEVPAVRNANPRNGCSVKKCP